MASCEMCGWQANAKVRSVRLNITQINLTDRSSLQIPPARQHSGINDWLLTIT